MEINYKLKYQQLKLQYVNSLDVAFRLGYEKGMQDAQVENMQQQMQAQAEQMLNQSAAETEGLGQPGQELGQESGQPEIPDSGVTEAGSELDQHIGQLEQLVSKSEMSPDDLKKGVADIVKHYKVAAETQKQMRKSEAAVKGIVKALAPKLPVKPTQTAKHNLNDAAQQALTMQSKIVDDVFKAWDMESQKATKQIADLAKVENLVKSK